MGAEFLGLDERRLLKGTVSAIVMGSTHHHVVAPASESAFETASAGASQG